MGSSASSLHSVSETRRTLPRVFQVLRSHKTLNFLFSPGPLVSECTSSLQLCTVRMSRLRTKTLAIAFRASNTHFFWALLLLTESALLHHFVHLGHGEDVLRFLLHRCQQAGSCNSTKVWLTKSSIQSAISSMAASHPVQVLHLLSVVFYPAYFVTGDTADSKSSQPDSRGRVVTACFRATLSQFRAVELVLGTPAPQPQLRAFEDVDRQTGCFDNDESSMPEGGVHAYSRRGLPTLVLGFPEVTPSGETSLRLFKTLCNISGIAA